MALDFDSIHNHNESAVFEAVRLAAPLYPGLGHDNELLADVACVALNRLPPRYIRHTVDFAFYQTESERQVSDESLADAVDYAFKFVQSRAAMGARC